MTTLVVRGMRWSSAVLGSIAWVAVFAAAQGGSVPLGTIEQLFLLAPLVVVPLGLRLAKNQREHRERFLHAAELLQPVAAALLVSSFWLPRGALAGWLASGWLLVSSLVGFTGLLRFLNARRLRIAEACFAVGMLYLPIGGIGVFFSRLGTHLFGFEEPIVLLTAIHFHYTAFATPIITGAVGRALKGSAPFVITLSKVVALGVITAPLLIATGFLFSPILQVISVVVLAVSLLGLAALLVVVLPRVRPHLAQMLLAVSAVSLVIGMLLACVYAIGEFREQFLISIPQMARTHGVINAFGFTLCGLLGWRLVAKPAEDQVR